MIYSTEALPTWALCYLINSDQSGLTDDEIEMVDNWCKDNNVSVVCTASDKEGNSEPYFSNYPAFGLPCDVIDCNIIIY